MSRANNPIEAYSKALAEVEKQVAELQKAVAAHAERTRGTPDWSHYGDLCAVKSQLDAVLSFINS